MDISNAWPDKQVWMTLCGVGVAPWWGRALGNLLWKFIQEKNGLKWPARFSWTAEVSLTLGWLLQQPH